MKLRERNFIDFPLKLGCILYSLGFVNLKKLAFWVVPTFLAIQCFRPLDFFSEDFCCDKRFRLGKKERLNTILLARYLVIYTFGMRIPSSGVLYAELPYFQSSSSFQIMCVIKEFSLNRVEQCLFVINRCTTAHWDRILFWSRGKSLLESWVITFLPDWQLPLIFVWFTSKLQEH